MNRLIGFLLAATVAGGCRDRSPPAPGSGPSGAAPAASEEPVARPGAARAEGSTPERAFAAGTPGAGSAPAPAAEEPSNAAAPPTASTLAEAAPSAAPARARPRRKPRAASSSSGAPSVELLRTGAPPLRALRYRFTAGTAEVVRFTTSTRVTVTVDGREAPSPASPRMSFETHVALHDVNERGASRTVRFDAVRLLPTPGVSEDVVQEVAQRISALAGLSGSDRMDPRGIVTEARIDTSSVTEPQVAALLESMAQSLGQMGVPFPEDPVGKGASWTTTVAIQQQGLSLTQRTDHELVGVDDEGGTLSLRIRQRAPRGAVRPPGLPPGATAELLSMEGSGSGRLQFRFDRTLARGKLTQKTRLELLADAGNQQQKLGLTTEVSVELTDP